MPPILSCDPARYGSDSSVLAICRGMVIEKLIVWRNTDTMRTVSRIEEEAAKVGVRPYRPASDYLPDANGRIVVDVVGIGAGIVDRLRQLGYRVMAFNGGAFTTDQRKFLNVRAASYWYLRTLLEEGKIALPRDSGSSSLWLATSTASISSRRALRKTISLTSRGAASASTQNLIVPPSRLHRFHARCGTGPQGQRSDG